MGAATSIIVGGMAVQAITGLIVATDAQGKANQSQTDQGIIEGAILDAENSRQDITNPYGNITNPYENLSVATKAAEFQAEQTDVALANTLDTLRASGASAGGATALAQAAARSKKQLSADIQKQEINIQELQARGEENMQKLQAEGEKFMFNKQEEREMIELDRLQSQLDQERTIEAEANQAKYNAYGNIMGGIGQGAGALGQIYG